MLIAPRPHVKRLRLTKGAVKKVPKKQKRLPRKKGSRFRFVI